MEAVYNTNSMETQSYQHIPLDTTSVFFQNIYFYVWIWNITLLELFSQKGGLNSGHFCAEATVLSTTYMTRCHKIVQECKIFFTIEETELDNVLNRIICLKEQLSYMMNGGQNEKEKKRCL